MAIWGCGALDVSVEERGIEVFEEHPNIGDLIK